MCEKLKQAILVLHLLTLFVFGVNTSHALSAGRPNARCVQHENTISSSDIDLIDKLIGKWSKKDSVHEVVFKLDADCKFSSTMTKKGHVVWRGAGSWWVKNAHLFWDYEQSTDEKKLSGRDEDQILEVSQNHLKLRNLITDTYVDYYR